MKYSEEVTKDLGELLKKPNVQLVLCAMIGVHGGVVCDKRKDVHLSVGMVKLKKKVEFRDNNAECFLLPRAKGKKMVAQALGASCFQARPAQRDAGRYPGYKGYLSGPATGRYGSAL